jgi:hypothetical protein
MKLSIHHRGRELLHTIMLLTRCLQLPRRAETMHADWEQDLAKARRDLDALYAAGLDRTFLSCDNPHRR